jgi:hypothetical protein
MNKYLDFIIACIEFSNTGRSKLEKFFVENLCNNILLETMRKHINVDSICFVLNENDGTYFIMEGIRRKIIIGGYNLQNNLAEQTLQVQKDIAIFLGYEGN